MKTIVIFFLIFNLIVPHINIRANVNIAQLKTLLDCNEYTAIGICGLSSLYMIVEVISNNLTRNSLFREPCFVPMIILGSESMMIASRSLPFFRRLWKFITRTLKDFCFGLSFLPAFGKEDMAVG